MTRLSGRLTNLTLFRSLMCVRKPCTIRFERVCENLFEVCCWVVFERLNNCLRKSLVQVKAHAFKNTCLFLRQSSSVLWSFSDTRHGRDGGGGQRVTHHDQSRRDYPPPRTWLASCSAFAEARGGGTALAALWTLSPAVNELATASDCSDHGHPRATR